MATSLLLHLDPANPDRRCSIGGPNFAFPGTPRGTPSIETTFTLFLDRRIGVASLGKLTTVLDVPHAHLCTYLSSRGSTLDSVSVNPDLMIGTWHGYNAEITCGICGMMGGKCGTPFACIDDLPRLLPATCVAGQSFNNILLQPVNTNKQ